MDLGVESADTSACESCSHVGAPKQVGQAFMFASLCRRISSRGSKRRRRSSRFVYRHLETLTNGYRFSSGDRLAVL